MDLTKLNYVSNAFGAPIHKFASRNLKIIVIFLGLIFLGSCVNSDKINEAAPPTDPPPIIIKSGSFIFKAPSDLIEPPLSPAAMSQDYVYTVPNFQMKSFWICKYTFFTQKPLDCKSYKPDELPLNIWFGNSAKADVTAELKNGNFVLTVLDKKLICKNGNGTNPPKKCRNDDVNMTKITVGSDTYNPDDDTCYAVGFFDKDFPPK